MAEAKTPRQAPGRQEPARQVPVDAEHAAAQDVETVRIAAVGDLHVRQHSGNAHRDLLAQIGAAADVLVLCGDLTEHGQAREAEVLAEELRASVIPVVAVLGNHDYESDQHEQVIEILERTGITVLDGDACEIKGVGFAGVKGFCGGFGTRIAPFWGERIMKEFVQESVNETMRLESALAKLRNDRIVVATHFAPIPETVAGEHPEVVTYLGCSRLAEPINRYPVCVAFHGHAHHGTAEGKTEKGVPVFNAALPLLRRLQPDRPFALFEV
jgi:Icc-related predicted phosphoesterase